MESVGTVKTMEHVGQELRCRFYAWFQPEIQRGRVQRDLLCKVNMISANPQVEYYSVVLWSTELVRDERSDDNIAGNQGFCHVFVLGWCSCLMASSNTQGDSDLKLHPQLQQKSMDRVIMVVVSIYAKPHAGTSSHVRFTPFTSQIIPGSLSLCALKIRGCSQKRAKTSEIIIFQ